MMLYNKHKLKTRDEEGVGETVPGIEDGKEYWVYSYIVRKVKGHYSPVYNITPRTATALIKDSPAGKILIVMKANKAYRFSMFSCYGRQVYFADTEEEATKAYNRLVNKVNKEFDVE